MRHDLTQLYVRVTFITVVDDNSPYTIALKNGDNGSSGGSFGNSGGSDDDDG